MQLVTRLDRTSWEPAVFCLSPPGALADDCTAAGVRVVCFGARRWSDIGVLFKLARELRQFQPAIVQTFLFHANLAGRIAGKLAGVKQIVSGVRVAEKRSRFPLWLDRWTNWLVQTNVCVSRAVADFSISQAGLSSKKIVVIPNGVDVAKFSAARPADLSAWRIPPGSQVLVNVGRLDRQKGLPDLIAAAALLAPKHRQLHFLLIGEGSDRPAIEGLIDRKGLKNSVHLAGWRADIPELLAAGYGFVLSSHWEGLPNAILEAMAASLPVVATSVEGSAELVIDGQTGYLVPPHSPGELALALERLVTDAPRARAMGKAGQERAQAEFTWNKMVSQYCEIYRSLAGELFRFDDDMASK